jgi:hypothetical protein
MLKGITRVKALAVGPRRHDRTRLPLGPGRQRTRRRRNVLDIHRNGIDATLLGLGHSTSTDLSPEDLIIPNGFKRKVGAAKVDD